jgi:hypothetical protein
MSNHTNKQKGGFMFTGPLVVPLGTSGAAATTKGELRYDTANNKLLVWTGSAWETVTSS